MCDKYSGMTVNERLYVSGKMEEYDLAVKEKKIEQIKSILKSLNLSEKDIKDILQDQKLNK